MSKTNFSYAAIVATLVVFITASCNNNVTDIPFPVNAGTYVQPVSQPLQFTAAKKLDWITVKTGGIKPVIKKFDVDALPSIPYDTTGFKPFIKPPAEDHFDWDKLPDAPFNMDQLASKPLKFKTSILDTPPLVKSAAMSPKGGSTISITEFGHIQGLQTTEVYSVFKDKSGFIWIASKLGIYRFDGEYIRRYVSGPFATPVSCIVEDNRGRIWYCIMGGGIVMLDPANGTISRSAEIGATKRIAKMVIDDKGNIWFSHANDKEEIIIDPQTQTFKRLDKSNGLSNTNVFTVVQDEKKNIWLTTLEGIDIINLETGRIKYLKKANGLSSDSLAGITVDKNDKIWVAVGNGGIDMVDIQQGTVKHYGKLQGIKSGSAYVLLCDNKGYIWMGTNHGVAIINTGKMMSRYIAQSDGIGEDFAIGLMQDNSQKVWVATFATGLNVIDQNGETVYPLGHKQLSTLLEDASGKIWAGTANDGILVLDAQKNRATVFKKQQGLADNHIQSFLEIDGNVWVTTDGGFDMIDFRHKTIGHIGSKEGLANDTIYALLKDRKNNIWLTGPSEGIDFIDSAKKSIRHASAATGLSDNNIVDIKEDKQGRIWVATYSNGVDVIDPENGTVSYLNNAPGLKDQCYKMLLTDEYGRMWIGTDKGIYVADMKQNTFTTITTAEGLPNDNISSLVEYNGQIVVGTHVKGSIITAPAYSAENANTSNKEWEIALLAKSEGLFNDGTSWSTNIATKEGEYLWADNGITVIHDIKPQLDSAPTFLTGISIMNKQQNFTSWPLLKEHDTLWTADSFYVKGKTPANTRDGLHWDSISGPYNLPENLRVPYDQNYLQFQFAQAHLGRVDTTLYCYILQGIDKQWSAFSSKTVTENYLNLSPGKYIFKVCSKNISGRWGEPAVFSFTITPPWWQTWWAYSIYILAAGAVLWGFIYLRSKRLVKENRILEHKVKLRTTEVLEQKEELMAQRDHLEQALEELQATQKQLIQSEKMASLGELTAGIAHEIQNPLNFVNNFSEVSVELAEELKEELNKIPIDPADKANLETLANDLMQNQQKINHHGKRADAIVKGMLQHSRQSTGQKEETDLNALADEYLRLSFHGLRAKDKSFNANMEMYFDETIGKINIVPQDIGRVLMNLFTNSFYSVTEKKKLQIEGYEPTVSISTKKLSSPTGAGPGEIEIRVRDNGMGIAPKALEKIYQPFFTTKPVGQGTGLGLSLSYDTIVKVHGGQMTVQTKEGEFAEFIIRLPA